MLPVVSPTVASEASGGALPLWRTKELRFCTLDRLTPLYGLLNARCFCWGTASTASAPASVAKAPLSEAISMVSRSTPKQCKSDYLHLRDAIRRLQHQERHATCPRPLRQSRSKPLFHAIPLRSPRATEPVDRCYVVVGVLVDDLTARVANQIPFAALRRSTCSHSLDDGHY